jgi:hypothetical protein
MQFIPKTEPNTTIEELKGSKILLTINAYKLLSSLVRLHGKFGHLA